MTTALAVPPPVARKLGAMPMADYLAMPGIGSSALKTLSSGTPLEYAYERDNRRPSTPSQQLGSAMHTALLEPEAFAERYVVSRKFDKRKKGMKDAEAQWLAECAERGVESLTQDQWDIALEASACVQSKGKLLDILRLGTPEEVWVAPDPITGILCKSRADWNAVYQGHLLIWDIKSAAELDDQSLERAVRKYGYGQQAAHYLDTIGASEPDLAHVWHILWVKNSHPVDMRVKRLPQAYVEHERAKNRRALDILAACESSGEWPGWPTRITELEMPGWAYLPEGTDR